jgi:tetratricopeptide (TPR) repeat protein
MQPFTPEFGQTQVEPGTETVTIGEFDYEAIVEDGRGWVRETTAGGVQNFGIEYALGGKNIFYFLTRLEGGKLQVLPLAYDVRKQEWFNSTGSMVRHSAELEDEALDWRERPLTFNTSCFGCHVSQLSTNYNLEDDTYRTVWAEPGINCETCHGPAGDHVKAFQEAAATGEHPEDLKIILTSAFSTEQTNSMCAPCHAKMDPLTPSFMPGDKFWDHYNLHTLEHADFYADGRDLGENYTMTSWLMSPCVEAGSFDCLHCHTSSGRNRHTGDDADNACLPCHEQHVKDPEKHSHHPASDRSSRCVSCHMPMTEFARMQRHDHSMLAPTPAATIEFESPNACNICHDKESSRWADRWVRKWYERDYQAPVLERARLLDKARRDNWSDLEATLEFLRGEDRNEVVVTSLIRTLHSSDDLSRWPILLELMNHESPLVRSATAAAMADSPDAKAVESLMSATADEFRVVRIEAARALSGYPRELMPQAGRNDFERAYAELENSYRSRPDQWSSHYNLGNLAMDRGQTKQALGYYKHAERLNPANILPLVNSSMAHARIGQNDQAEAKLRKALELDAANAAVHFNLGLILAERGDRKNAKDHLRAALEADQELAPAAYNLGVLMAPENLDEAVDWCGKAWKWRPDDPKYGYTYAFYLLQQGETAQGQKVLRELLKAHPSFATGYALLADSYQRQGQPAKARAVYEGALKSGELPPAARQQFEARLRQ